MADQDVELSLLTRLVVMGVDVQKEGIPSFPFPHGFSNPTRNHLQNDPWE